MKSIFNFLPCVKYILFGFIALVIKTTAYSGVTVSGNINTTTWTKASSPYTLSGTVTVPAGQTLTIQPGVTVIFPRFDYNLIVNGKLMAQGIVTDSIRFSGKGAKSYNVSSTHGGYIGLNKDSSVLNYISIDSMGDASRANGAILISGNFVPTISNTTVKNSEGTDIYAWAGGAKNFTNVKAIIKIDYGTLAANATMPKITGASYFMTGILTVNAGVTLTIKPGVSLYFPRYNYHLIVNGKLDAQGTASDSIRFIGKADLAYTTSSTHGGYISLRTDSSVIRYASLDSMGDASSADGAIVVSGNVTPTITNTTVRRSEAGDIYAWAGGAKNFANIKATIKVGYGTLAANATMPKITGATYVMTGILTVNAGVTLTIKPGVSLYFPRYNYHLIVNGKLDAQGTTSDSIRFIGKADLAYTTSSTHGGYISLKTDSSVIRYASVDSMGDVTSSDGAVVIADNVTPTITNTSIKNSELRDIYCWAGGGKNLANIKAKIFLGSGNLTVNAVMPKIVGGSYYLTGTLTVNAGTKLTINAGVLLYFPRYNYHLVINGILSAQGTVSDSIRFVGKNDRSYNPSSTHGGYIRFTKDSSVLKYVRIDSLGDVSSSDGAVIIENNIRPAITSTTVTNSESTDLYAWLGAAKNINNLNGVITIAGGTYSTDETLPKIIGNTYFKLGGNVTVSASNSLTVQPGVILLFPSVTDLVVDGTLIARGTKNDTIRFKGTKTPSSSTLFGGNLFLNKKGSTLNFASLDSLGGSSYGALVLSANCNVINCSFRKNKNAGIYIKTSLPDISYCDLYNNEIGISSYYSKAVVNNCNIFNNTSSGVSNLSAAYPVDATNNYWGSASGPYHPKLNPAGSGNKVSDSVKISPFKTARVLPVLPFINSFTPMAARSDSAVIISGLRFTGTTSVRFGNTPAKSFTVVNDTTIKAIVATGTSGLIKVVTAKGADSLDGFLYCPGLSLKTDFTPAASFFDVYTNNTSTDATGYTWAFGDNATSTEASPIHHYIAPATYNVCLTATNACAKTSKSLCKPVVINGLTIADDDKDGLLDLLETTQYGTSLLLFDTNNDGLGDGLNVFAGFLPLLADSDNDGISNIVEMANGTNPLLADSDSDGVSDKLDPFPLDRFKSRLPPPNPADRTAPVIVISEPF